MIAYGAADTTATLSSFAALKSRMCLTFVLDERPINGCQSILNVNFLFNF